MSPQTSWGSPSPNAAQTLSDIGKGEIFLQVNKTMLILSMVMENNHLAYCVTYRRIFGQLKVSRCLASDENYNRQNVFDNFRSCQI